MKQQSEIQSEADLVYKYALQVAKEQGRSYVQSWWLNRRNCPELWMDTPKINRRLMLLVRQGKLSIDRANTSTSQGTCYRILEMEVKNEQ